MFTNSNLFGNFRILLYGIILIPLLYNQSFADYCNAETNIQDEYICEFSIGDINNTDCKFVSTIADYTNLSTKITLGDSVKVFVKNAFPYANDKVSLWIDWNGNGTFDVDTETFNLTSDDNSYTFTDTIVIPTNAALGKTRLRVRMVYNSTISPCGEASYGEVEDYTVELVAPLADAEIYSLNSPPMPFLMGSYSVKIGLKSNKDVALTTCKIDWWLNNVFQGTYSWNGNLGSGSADEVTLGNYNFVYPSDETNFDPFTLKFTVKDVNNNTEDANPLNDTYIVQIIPSLNDCGAIGCFGPDEGFGAGNTAIRARIKNYGPKPLTSVKINWKMDGIVQTPKVFTGLNIKQNEIQDLNIGTFNFFYKTPIVPFNVEVWTELPNNLNDDNSVNDKYEGLIAPMLIPGTYFAGGNKAHFLSPADAASYLNMWGVFGIGTVNFEIRSGIYDNQIVYNNSPLNKNPIVFRSTTGLSGDVTISFSPKDSNNYIVNLKEVSNVKFENVTIQNNNNNLSNAGRLVVAENVDCLIFYRVIFKGINLSPKTGDYNLITAKNTINISLIENEFNFGSTSFWSNSSILPKTSVIKNVFNSFSQFAIYNVNNFAESIRGDILITENTFKSTNGLIPNGVVYLLNGAVLTNNIFTNIKGAGKIDESLIKLSFNYPNNNNTGWIVGNKISNCFDFCGIQVDNANTMVNKNFVEIKHNSNNGCQLLFIKNSTGVAGNNMLLGKNILGIEVNSSPEFLVLYNSASIENNENPLVKISGTQSTIMRNIFINKGNGTTINAESSNNTDENILFSAGEYLAKINGVNFKDIQSLNNSGIMNNSFVLNVDFFGTSDLHLKVFNPLLFFHNPLYKNSNDYAMYIENNDIDDELRKSYFAGVDEINFSIKIVKQSTGINGCEGSSVDSLFVNAFIDYNIPLKYQWEHNEVAIKGATEPILYFPSLELSQAGTYRCLINGPGNTYPIYSDNVKVNVFTKVNITSEPSPMAALKDENISISFDAQVNGKNIAEAVAKNEAKVQWYKFADDGEDMILVDNNWISGSKTNRLNFTKFRLSDQGLYYAIIENICGSDTTNKARVFEKNNEITFNTQPESLTLCEVKDVNLFVDATTQSNSEINYQWYKNGTKIFDNMNKYEGAKTKQLLIRNFAKADNADYYAVASLTGTSTESASNSVTVKLIDSPLITKQPENITIISGKKLLLSVSAAGENLVYDWYKDEKLLISSHKNEYIVDSANLDDAGEYYVFIQNQCNKVLSNTVVVTVKNSTDVVEVSKNGYSLSTAMPNPVSDNSVITFAVPIESFVKVTLTDASGASRVILTDGNFAEGTHTINVDANKLNLVSGTYFYFLESNGVRLSQKMVVIK